MISTTNSPLFSKGPADGPSASTEDPDPTFPSNRTVPMAPTKMITKRKSKRKFATNFLINIFKMIEVT
jgi:hypothetical protein